MFLFLFSDPSNCTDVQLRVQSIGEQCLLADVGNSSFYPGKFNSYSGHASFLQFLVRGTPEFTGPRRVRHRLHMRVHREERELQSLNSPRASSQRSRSIQSMVPNHFLVRVLHLIIALKLKVFIKY